MAEPIIDRLELKRLPFQRRPVAQPGTTLVFQMPDGRLVAPRHPYTTGETWWKGPKWAYVVDVKPHATSFSCQLPCAGDALFFQANVNYTWSVSDPAALVDQQVTDPEAECQAHLMQRLPMITRRYESLKSADAELGVQRHLGAQPIELAGRGVRIHNLYVHMRMDSDQGLLAKQLEIDVLKQRLAEKEAEGKGRVAWIEQQDELKRQTQKQEHLNAIVSGGTDTLYAYILREDPTKGLEVVNRMIAMSEREEQRTLEAIKVLIDGGEIRLGELDGAVSAAVKRISAILGKDVGGPDAIGAGSDKALPAAENEDR